MSYNKKEKEGYITIKLRKQEAVSWLNRWSPRGPRREQTNDVETHGNGEPIITTPSDDDSD